MNRTDRIRSFFNNYGSYNAILNAGRAMNADAKAFPSITGIARAALINAADAFDRYQPHSVWHNYIAEAVMDFDNNDEAAKAIGLEYIWDSI